MTDNIFEKMLVEKMEKSNGGQMTAEEYRYIASFLGNKNFLVFGTGHDTPLWKYSNKEGKTFFLENISKWIDPTDSSVFKVNYATRRSQYKELLEEYHQGNFSRLTMELPKEIVDIKWDCIFVDSPKGTSEKSPGRMQSIFASSRLASKDTDIFVHDVDRTVEDVYSTEMFSTIINELTKLRHVKL